MRVNTLEDLIVHLNTDWSRMISHRMFFNRRIISRRAALTIGMAVVGAGIAVPSARLAVAAASDSMAAPPTVINAITQPSERHKLSFAAAGIIKDELVKEGDAVKAGQTLLSQDDVLETDEMEKARVEAESTAKVDAAVADYNAKKHIYERKLDTYKKGGANLQEVEDAELDMILRDKQINVAKDDQSEAKIKFQQEQKKVQDMHLASPVDGFVERIIERSGEMADPQKPDGACWVVKNDPLFIELRDLSSKQAAHLRVGDQLQVKYGDEAQWQPATVSFRSPVVDAASDTQLVKLTLPNPHGRDAGLQIQVQLPAAVSESASPQTSKAGDKNGADAGIEKSAAANP